MNPVSAVGIGLSGLGAIGSMFGIKKRNRRLDELVAKDPKYAMNQYAGKRLGLANQLFNSRMAGANELERNIFSNQANYQGAVERSATDSSAALAAAAAGQGNTNQALSDLQIAESQNKYNMLGNLNSAYAGMIAEGDKMYEDNVRRYGNLTQAESIKEQNRQAPWKSLMNLGSSLTGFNGGGNFGETNRSVARGLESGGVSGNALQTYGGQQRTTVNTPTIGTVRPTPTFRPLASTNFVQQRPAINFPRYNQMFYGR